MTSSSKIDRKQIPLYTPEFLFAWAANFFTMSALGGLFLLPLFIKDRGGSESDIGILMGALTLSSVIARPWIAQAIDHFGRKKSLMLGTASFILLPLPFLLFDGPLSGFYGYAFSVRIVHGIGVAFAFTSVFTLVADIIPTGRLNEGLGMFGITGLTGMAAGPAISEPIIRNFGFDPYFITISVLGTISLLLQFKLPETLVSEGERLDEGISFLDVVKRKKTMGVGLMMICFGAALATQNNFVSPFAEELGLSSISVFFIAYSLAAILTRVFGARIADQVGERRVIPWALLLIATGYFSLVFVNDIFMLIVSGFITGAGHGFLFPCLNALAIRNEPVEIRGKINGAFTGSQDLGMFVGSIILGYIGEWFGYRMIFISTCLVLLIGLGYFLGHLRRIIRMG